MLSKVFVAGYLPNDDMYVSNTLFMSQNRKVGIVHFCCNAEVTIAIRNATLLTPQRLCVPNVSSMCFQMVKLQCLYLCCDDKKPTNAMRHAKEFYQRYLYQI